MNKIERVIKLISDKIKEFEYRLTITSNNNEIDYCNRVIETEKKKLNILLDK